MSPFFFEYSEFSSEENIEYVTIFIMFTDDLYSWFYFHDRYFSFSDSSHDGNILESSEEIGVIYEFMNGTF